MRTHAYKLLEKCGDFSNCRKSQNNSNHTYIFLTATACRSRMGAYENTNIFHEKKQLLQGALHHKDYRMVTKIILGDETFSAAFINDEFCTKTIQLKLMNAAIWGNNEEAMKFLIDHGCSVDFNEELMEEIKRHDGYNYGNPPLWNAIKLIKRDDNYKHGDPPLRNAIGPVWDRLPKMLIQAGANVHQRGTESYYDPQRRESSVIECKFIIL